MRVLLPAICLALAPLPAATAQAPRTRSPYAGQPGPVVNALSDEVIQGYLAGRGMALALPAELNHYPGPRHVLDLADSLQLTGAQRDTIRAIYADMNRRVVPLGRSLVAVESRLDSAFARGTIEPAALAALLRESAEVTEQLRLAHLSAHLDVRALLTSQQIAAYDRLRGHGQPADHTHEHMHDGPAGSPSPRQ